MQFAFITGQNHLAENFYSNVKKAFDVMDAWEFNGKHLVYVPQSGNWADEYVQHGYILYDQLLRIWALELAGKYYSHTQWLDKASAIRETLVTNFWNSGIDPTKLYSPNLIHQLQKAPTQYWLMGFNPARVYAQFDLAANALSILIGLGNDTQSRAVTDYILQQLAQKKFLLPSFSPVIEKHDFMMQELSDNYAYHFRNMPHEFHNGGLWPVWNGWLGAAMYSIGEQSIGDTLLRYMQEANKMNTSEKEWGFYENFHGITHAPIGVPYCTWSASGIIIAENYRQGKRFYSNN
jgi:glycogen debranching enzyme